MGRQVRAFGHILLETYGVYTTVRKHMGRDTDAACGQLALKSFEQQVPGARKGWKARIEKAAGAALSCAAAEGGVGGVVA